MNKNQLFVVRHGESENNILRIDCSKLENKDKYGLTEKGKKEVRVQAGGFEDFDLIVTSPFKRALETAEIFAEFSKCELIENVQLKEVDYGDFELCEYGTGEVFFKENGCDENIPFPNGESLMGARNRTTEFLKQIEQEHSGKKEKRMAKKAKK